MNAEGVVDKFLFDHSSIQTTERFMGWGQEIEITAKDDLGL
jgi:hypothetical protein